MNTLEEKRSEEEEEEKQPEIPRVPQINPQSNDMAEIPILCLNSQSDNDISRPSIERHLMIRKRDETQ